MGYNNSIFKYSGSNNLLLYAWEKAQKINQLISKIK